MSMSRHVTGLPGIAPPTPRRLARSAAVVASVALTFWCAGRLDADRSDQRAADDYRKAVALVEKGRYEEAIPLLLGAIARAPEPNEAQGSERRFRTRYDPYYWLGVAQMELGRADEALTNFERSDSIVAAGYAEPVIRRWEREYADLKRRRAALLLRLQHEPPLAPAAPAPTPAPPPALPSPTPSPIPVAPTLEPPARPAEPALALDDVRELVSRLERWSRHPRVGSELAPILAPSRARLDRALRGAAGSERTAKASSELERLARAEEGHVRSARARIRSACLRRIGEDFAAQRWDEALSTLELAREVDATAPENDLLAATLLATRYLMEGSRDERSLLEARRRFQAWRSRAGARAPVPRLVSPSLALLLDAPGPR